MNNYNDLMKILNQEALDNNKRKLKKLTKRIIECKETIAQLTKMIDCDHEIKYISIEEITITRCKHCGLEVE